MADLIAIGYDDEHTAEEAANEVERLSEDLLIEPDAVAVIVRDQKGRFHVHTNHHVVAVGTMWGMFWGLLFGVLFFVPVLGVAIGAGIGAIMGLITKVGIEGEFQRKVREMLRPGTSALFLIVEKVTPDKVIDALAKYGGTVLKTSLPRDLEEQIQEALHGARRDVATAAAGGAGTRQTAPTN